jgi:hypothetical protein
MVLKKISASLPFRVVTKQVRCATRTSRVSVLNESKQSCWTHQELRGAGDVGRRESIAWLLTVGGALDVSDLRHA